MSELAALCRIETAPDDAPETLEAAAVDAELIYTCYAPITARVIAAASKLRGIVKYGVGVDSIDLEAAARRGIPVVHAPDYGTETVADQAFALLIAAARKIPLVDRDLKAAGWLWPAEKYCGVDLAGKTIGIVGFGRIGRAMARRAAGFGMRRLIYDPYVDAVSFRADELQFAPLAALLAEADFLSLHCVLSEETRGMIAAAELAEMKETAILINVSRGPLVDEQALIAALAAGRIAAAGLDVFAREPLGKGHPLLESDRVVCSPHFAFYSREAYQRLEQDCLEKIRTLLRGELPRDVKNAELLERYGNSPQNDFAAEPAAVWQPDASEGDMNLSPHRQRWHDQLGAENRRLLDRDAKVFIHQALSTPCLSAIERSEGIYLIDADGRRIMDFHGNSAHQVGYGHPHVTAALKAELDRLPFCPRRYTCATSIRLAERLVEIAPAGLEKVLFAPGGAAAIGIAMKLARYATGCHKTISMWDSFHGASLDTISIGGEAHFRDGLGPLLPGALHVSWPQDVDDVLEIERLLAEHGDIGAVIAEPIRCTTIAAPPAAYWQRVRELCDRYGALLIFDEIPIALGRTGSWFYCEQVGVLPDMLVLGKGLGGAAFPIAAVLARRELDRFANRSLGHYTHEKSSLGAAAALATLEVIEAEDLLARARTLGQIALDQLRAFARVQPLIADIRGIGLSLAVEIGTESPGSSDAAERIMIDCLRQGLSFKVSAGNVLTLTPPLVIEEGQLDEALTILKQSIEAIARDVRPLRC
jgi:4-aminobutyrate aminotransferase